jgi:hypothetical protein
MDEVDLPVHPEVVKWLQIYAAASEEEHDRVVAQILEAWNAELLAGKFSDVEAQRG